MSATQPPVENLELSASPKNGAADATITIKGVVIPVRRWAVVWISLLAVVLAASLGGIYIWKNWNEAEARIRSLKVETTRLEKIKSDSEDATQAKLQEYKFHFGEQGQVLTGPNGWVTVTTYPSDGCILISRKSANAPYGRTLDDWILSPLKAPKSAPPETATPASFNMSSPPDGVPSQPVALPPAQLRSVAFEQALRQELGQADTRLMPVQSGCRDPHPGPFQSAWGRPNGCWVPLYRTWRDGCRHYQWYNSCSGQWNARIYWNFCASRHFW